MSGMVGICSKHALNLGYVNKLVADMAREITYTSGDLIDRWDDNNVAIARVYHGVVNPEAQPIFNEDSSLCVVMDGEVFDYDLERRSLIEKGHHFRMRSNDAEYCLHIYGQYGPEAFVRLNGSFLLALYDRTMQELLLINDRFSSRPLFYYCDGEQLIFGTQLRPLLKFPGLPRRLDLQAVFEFFTFQRVLGDRTYYRDVKALPPASILRFSDRRISLSRYWQMRYRNEPYPEEYYVETLANVLRRAMARQTRGDHRLGILLSGGLDSRAVLAAAEEGKISVAFTFGDFVNREVQIARKLANTKGCKHIFLQRDIDHYYRLVDEAIDIGDGMYRFDNAHVVGLLRDIRLDSDILLDTYGFDVRFKGFYFIHKTISVLGRTISTPLLLRVCKADSLEVLKRLSLSTFPSEPNRLFNPRYKLGYNDTILSSMSEVLESIETQDTYNMIEYMAANSFRSLAAYLLVLCVRSYMEQRSIIFDNDMLDFSLSMPPKFRSNGRVFRKALRKLSPELVAIPNANTGLRADLPVWPEWLLVRTRGVLRKMGVLPRPKLPHPVYTNGSWPNKAELIRYNEKLKRLIGETLHDPECIDPDLFNVKAIDSIFERHINRGEDFTDLLLLLLTFGRWHKKYGPE